jgi:zinc D-Ala-D-Ala carboxypeptidase
MQLTPNFHMEELIASEVAARSGIDNTPPDALMPNLQSLAEGLETIRAILGGRPIHINSGYRCPRLNSAVGGAPGSRHMQGLAADIVCPQFGSPLQVCLAIADSGLPVDQVIHEFGKWCHVSFGSAELHMRNELLTIASAARGYQNGLHAVG